MARRTHPKPVPPGIITAQLDGTAGYCLYNVIPHDETINRLREITTDPVLLGQAAGTALGGWQANPVAAYDGAMKAELLTDAGADPDLRDQVAAQTCERLTAEAGRRGIGN